MSVVEAVERDLKKLPKELAESALGASALSLAAEMDQPNSATSKSMCARALLETLDRLRSLAPPKREEDELDDLRTRRAKRKAAG